MGRAFHWSQLPGAQFAKTHLPVHTAWSALHNGNADMSAPPNSPRPSLAEDCSKRPRRGSAFQKPHGLLFCHINRPPLPVGSGHIWPVLMPSARSAPACPQPLIGMGPGPRPDQGSLHTPDLLSRSLKGPSSTAVFMRCQLWPSPGSGPGDLDPGRGSSGIRQTRGDRAGWVSSHGNQPSAPLGKDAGQHLAVGLLVRPRKQAGGPCECPGSGKLKADGVGHAHRSLLCKASSSGTLRQRPQPPGRTLATILSSSKSKALR